MNPTRREVLGAGAGAAAGALAGCLGTLGLAGDDPDGYTAFFSLLDFAGSVGGDVLEFETPVETGEMGHGWTPDGNIVPDIVATDLFIYLDTAEFQWAVDAAAALERDHGDDIILVNALEGLGPHLLPFDGGDDPPEPAHDRDFTRDELAIEEFQIWDLRTDQQEGWWHGGLDHWHGGPPNVAVGDEIPLGVVVHHVQDERLAVPLGEDERFNVAARFAEGADEDVLDIDSQGDRVVLQGRAVGETELVFEIYDGDQRVEETAADPARVTVVEEYDDAEMPGSFDPHAWVDPVLAGRMVETIAEQFAAYDPDNADTYQANAADYREELAAVDEQFEQLIADAELDVAIFAGHNSFQYVEHRYGFELVTPTGVSPNEDVSFDDISRLIGVIEEYAIDTVLYDPFEAARPGEDVPQMVEAIFENSDVEHAEPLSPISGVTPEWDEQGWGWVEQMENVNIPSLEAALNPD